MTKNNRPPLTQLVQRGELMSADCPSREILLHMTSRWGVLVLMVLAEGTQRFSTLRRKIGGISERMLSHTLQALEGDGILQRVSYPEVPPRVEYTLTPLGQEAAEKVSALADWIEVSVPRFLQARADRVRKP